MNYSKYPNEQGKKKMIWYFLSDQINKLDESVSSPVFLLQNIQFLGVH